MTVEDEVRTVAAEFVKALLRNDADEVAAFMTDDWVYLDAAGVTTKAEVIGAIASGQLAHHTMDTVGDSRVVRAGNSVISSARQMSSGTWAGEPYTADEWITDVFVPVDGTWQCAFSQKTDAG